MLPTVQEAVISLGWKAPTAVQAASMPPMLKGGDVCLQGATGSGKTAAFAIPIVQRVVMERSNPTKKPAGPCAMVLSPSVELVEQTTEVIERLAKYVKPRVATLDASSRPS